MNPTVFDFVLPQGYIDPYGQVHRQGQMRLAIARDEIESLQDPLVQANELYLPVVLLTRVILQLGNLPVLDTTVVENLFAADLAYLEDLYQRINSPYPVHVSVSCPYCASAYDVQVAPMS